jgi:hypothetical protein
LGIACLAAGLLLAAHYPLSAPSAMLVFVLAVVACWLRPRAWIVLVPALLPVIGFAPWTGWITFEELDLLVLAAAAAGYARRAWHRSTRAKAATPDASLTGSAAALIGLTVLLFAISTLVAMARGFVDAGGFAFGWFHGYREPMNSARLAKPFFAALLLWSLWNSEAQEDPDRAARHLSLGMMLGLLGASLAALWERLAFTGLLNFSADYRTTALFWEMHVGGAALDGFLALTMPFAVREMLVAPTKARWALAAAVTALGTYACLTTFSRGVYLAVPIGLGLMWALQATQRRRDPRPDAADMPSAPIARLVMTVAFMLAVAWMFQSSGYRGLLALAGSLMLLLPVGAALRNSTRSERVAGSCIGVVLALTASGIAWLVPKGPYLLYALGVLFTLAMLGLQRRSRQLSTGRHAAALAWAGYVWVLASMLQVVLYWGSEIALVQALPVSTALFVTALASACSRRELWPTDLRWQGNTLGAVLLSGSIVPVLLGGAYMGDRFATAENDLAGRLAHWSLSASMLDGSADWALGKGLGRYGDNYAIAAPENLRPGDYRLQMNGQAQHVTLTGGGQLTGDPDKPMSYGGDLLRLSQRLAFPAGRPQVSFEVRSAKAADLSIGVCTKHLLYPDACLGRGVRVEAKPGQWQSIRAELQGNLLKRGTWYAPQLVAFTIGVDSSGSYVEVANLSLTDADGREMLSNGNFADGLSYWFFTSDRSHLPWHAKNMALHVLFDQGLIGLVLLSVLTVGALWRLVLGRTRNHMLAPSLAGAIAGFAVVGVFDSLLDVPRIAILFYWLLLLALTLKPPASTLIRTR